MKRRILLYIAALAAPVFSLFLRFALERRYGELPPYLISYPFVFLVALWGGMWPGLLATTTAAVIVSFWVLHPRGQLGFERTADIVGLVIFCVMGVGISIVSELYHRNRKRAAFYQQEQAVEAARRVADTRYHVLFNAIDEGFGVIEVLFDENRRPYDLRFLQVNPAFERQSGLEHAEGKTAYKLIPDFERRWIEIYGKIAVTGEPIRLIEFSPALNRWFDLYAFRVGETEQHRVAVLFSNITERKRTEEALLRSEKLAATGRLATTIAHEVNNPLAAAMNAVYIASTNPANPTQTSEMLKLAEQELRRAAHITQQTLGFYRESTGVEHVALPKLVDEVLSVYATKLQNRKISVRCRYNCNPGSRREGCPEKCEQCEGCLVVHAGELRQVISNLLANGIDAISDGGVMHIRVSQLSDKVRLTIADDGHGIRTEHLKRIFEPFFTTKETSGTGLGLWVTQELVRKHDGVIKVRSRRDKGTVFRLTFPQRTASDGHVGGAAPNPLAKSA